LKLGDHVGIYPMNKFELIHKILIRIEKDLKLAAEAAETTMIESSLLAWKTPYVVDPDLRQTRPARSEWLCLMFKFENP